MSAISTVWSIGNHLFLSNRAEAENAPDKLKHFKICDIHTICIRIIEFMICAVGKISHGFKRFILCYRLNITSNAKAESRNGYHKIAQFIELDITQQFGI